MKGRSNERLRRERQKRLTDLEALEAGYLPEEVERGEHQASHIPPVGCLSVVVAIVAIFWLLFR